ncbi:MAG: aldo/keto reductase [Solirubrobacterales bacterium]|nr:aldo/keto reductase [Solirubrobacterales bacterium]
MSTDPDRDEALARATIAAAAASGITVFDTAHAYRRDDADLGHNERLLASALRESGAHTRARVVTKGGMTRPAGAWVPDGRAKSILADCEASLEALDGLPIDLYLLHAPDPRTPWRTSVRALARLLDEQLVSHVGLSNVNRAQLDEALELVPVTAVELGLGPLDDRPLRGGMVERCADLGIAVVAHSPLGGPRRAGGLGRREALAEISRRCAATPAEVGLAWLLDLDPAIVAIPGARRPETARSSARAATLELDAEARMDLRRAFGGTRPARLVSKPASDCTDAEVVLIMGIPGAGKSRVAQDYVARGYARLNRDERGGALRDLADALNDELSRGAHRVVLDNTYLTRSARSYVIETASRHGIATRCTWLDTSLAEAQVNLVERLLDELGALPAPDELRRLARNRSGLLAPASQMRTARELEPPSTDEGFTCVEKIEFTRAPSPDRARPGVFIAAAALEREGWERAVADGDPGAPHLLFHWSPGATPETLDAAVANLARHTTGPIERALCPHPAGPPICWCRPPLPGLPLAFARAHDLDPSRSVLIGTGPAHRNLAAALGARNVGL